MSSEGIAKLTDGRDPRRSRDPADVLPILGELAKGLREVLAGQLVGLYLGGSFALGDADEDSDLDFIVAVRRPLDDAAVVGLQALHAHIHDLPDHWAPLLEGSYVPIDVLRGIDRRDEPLWYLDNGSCTLTRSTHCNTAVVRQTIREHGIVIEGPDPHELIDPVPVTALRGEMLVTLRSWAHEIIAEPGRWSSRFYQGFILLHHCRVWADLETGTVGTKHGGAVWAEERLDASWHDLIDRAWLTRHDPAQSARTPADADDYARTLDLVRLVVARFAGVEIDRIGGLGVSSP